MMMLRTEFDEAIFEQIALIWNLTGVGNPARGDRYESIEHTLQHGGRIFTLWEADSVIGTLWATHDYRRLYIHHMAIHPAFQRKHLSHLLLEEALSYAHELGYQAKLEVHHKNAPARHLYGKYGFTDLEGYEVMIKRDIPSHSS